MLRAQGHRQDKAAREVAAWKDIRYKRNIKAALGLLGY